jgi:catechol 2,3-dioxygenase
MMPDRTTVGPVALTVSSLDAGLGFYRDVLGLHVAQRNTTTAVVSAGAAPLVALVEVAGARRPPRGATGLYHLAILVPTRPALARALARLVAARYPLQGASDHLVSEALYLVDPDGHGIEIYADRPRDRWPRRGETVQMAADALDLEGLLRELDRPGGGDLVDPATRIGHVHLRVADLAVGEAFYQGVLGFEVTQRDYPGALFVAAGGYHHHIGMNVWGSAGGTPPPAGSLALRWFAICLPDAAGLTSVLERARAAGVATQETRAGWRLRDPSQNTIILAAGEMGIAAAASGVALDADHASS